MELNGLWMSAYNEAESSLQHSAADLNPHSTDTNFHHNGNGSLGLLNQTQHLPISEEAWACLFHFNGSSVEDLLKQADHHGRALNSSDINSNNNNNNSSFPFLRDNGSIPSLGICNRSWDGILCWPETVAGAEATLSCFAQLNGVRYDTTRKANILDFCILLI
jgi:hypothetical protein